jgi:hypothetical protein
VDETDAVRTHALMDAVIKDWRNAGVSEFVYLIQMGDDGPVKVGRAVDPLKRVTCSSAATPRNWCCAT